MAKARMAGVVGSAARGRISIISTNYGVAGANAAAVDVGADSTTAAAAASVAADAAATTAVDAVTATDTTTDDTGAGAAADATTADAHNVTAASPYADTTTPGERMPTV